MAHGVQQRMAFLQAGGITAGYGHMRLAVSQGQAVAAPTAAYHGDHRLAVLPQPRCDQRADGPCASQYEGAGRACFSCKVIRLYNKGKLIL